MGTGEQSNLSYYVKSQFRKLRLYHLLIASFILFLLIIPYYNNYYHNDFIDNGYSPELPFVDNLVQNMTCPHYKIGLFIFSQSEQVDKRNLMREELFGITDNIIPCMRQDTTEIFYKFVVNKSEEINMSTLHLYTAEKMEYNDIVEIDIQNSDDWHQYLLEYVSFSNFGWILLQVIRSCVMMYLLTSSVYYLIIYRLKRYKKIV
ncbi:hypothetical protein RclHR1_02160001 [Rhizophagus clarus]|uniref:Uncharacterized protein n=1 Tax=Rhizophagus clarus TaxID=94130 RepID=A0A2Z6QUW6_9GLOM|nr:hypothetical protein RclHR1_02160001 [Rhizophagus clarus]